jgi:alpha-L-rhamnosidase
LKQVFSLFLVLQIGLNAFSQQWQGKWITAAGVNNKPNTWVAFRTSFFIGDSTIKLPLRIAADTKYWLWVNNKLVVYEGGLKRGPTPADTYYDSLDIAGYLVKGTNSIGVLLWYFGKEGFSHKNSDKAGVPQYLFCNYFL